MDKITLENALDCLKVQDTDGTISHQAQLTQLVFCSERATTTEYCFRWEQMKWLACISEPQCIHVLFVAQKSLLLTLEVHGTETHGEE